MKTLLYFSILALVTLNLSCKDGGMGTGPSLGTQTGGSMLLRFDGAPSGITSVLATLTRESFPTRTLLLQITDSSASGGFEEVAVGVWHLRVDARDSSEFVRYSGQTDVEVHPGETSDVSLQLLPTSGGINIIVTWGTPSDPRFLLYLPFNGNANDESGHGNNGMVSGAELTADRDGTPRRAYGFDGLDNHILIPDIIRDTTQAFTISVWAKTDDIMTRRICVYLGARSGEAWIEVDTGAFSFRVHQTDWTEPLASAPAIPGEFNHVVGVYRRGASLQIWINGVLRSTANISNSPLNSGRMTHESSVGSYAPQWLDWGRQNNIYSWLGTIDQVRIYARALDQAEIQALFEAGE